MIFFNIISLIFLAFTLTLFFILWIRAELRLAKYGKSFIFEENTNEKK